MTMRQVWLALGCLLSLAILAMGSGCSGSGSGSGEDAAKPQSASSSGGSNSASKPGTNPSVTKGTIALSVLTTNNPFFVTIGEAMKAEAAKHGYEVLVVDGAYDVRKQQDQVKDFLVKKVAAIVLCPCDSKAIGSAIKEANQAGVPVFTADIGCLDPTAKVICHVATDNYSGGKQAGVAMIEALGEAGGKVAILDLKTVESCQLRVKGFKEVIDAHNAKTTGGKIQVVAELNGGGEKDIGFKAAQDALQANPDLAGIFAINDPSALGARASLEKAGKADRIKLIGFDGQPEGKQAIKDGKIYADPIQYPDQIGVKTVQAIMKHLEGEAVEKELLIPTGLYRKADALKDPEL